MLLLTMSRQIQIYSQADKNHAFLIVGSEAYLGGGRKKKKKRKTYRIFVIIFGCPLLDISIGLTNLNYKYSHLIKQPHNDKNETLISFKWSL